MSPSATAVASSPGLFGLAALSLVVSVRPRRVVPAPVKRSRDESGCVPLSDLAAKEGAAEEGVAEEGAVEPSAGVDQCGWLTMANGARSAADRPRSAGDRASSGVTPAVALCVEAAL